MLFANDLIILLMYKYNTPANLALLDKNEQFINCSIILLVFR